MDLTTAHHDKVVEYVLGIDPGGTTGIALVQVSPLRLVLAEALSPVDMLDRVNQLVRQADLVTIERYTISARTLKLSRQLDALYLIGATTLACHQECVKLELEMVSSAKTAFPDEMLKLHGVWSGNKHVRDATRHALLAMRRHRVLLERV